MRKSEATEEAKWEVKSLGRLCDLLNGLAFKPEDWIEFGLPIIRIQNLNGGTEFNFCDGTKVPEAYIITPGTLLFSWSGNRGTSFGPYIWNGPKGALNQHIFKVTEKPNINRRWLFYALDEVRQKAERAAHGGSGLVHVRRGDLLLYTINAPLEDEQRHIAEVLDTIEAAIQRTDTLINKLKWMKAGLLHDLLTRGLDRKGKLRDPVRHPEQFEDKQPFGLIPKDWDTVPVEEVGYVQLGRQRSPKHQTGRFSTPYLRVANIFDGFIDYSDVLKMDFTSRERETYGLLPGDILLNEGQSLELVGRSAIYEGEPNEYCFQNTLVRFRCKPNSMPQYCQAVFRYWLDTGRFTRIAKQTTSVAHLGADRFAKMMFPCPEVDEQTAITERLRAHDVRIHVEESNREKLIQLKKGLMHDLLTGRVRMPATKSEVVAV